MAEGDDGGYAALLERLSSLPLNGRRSPQPDADESLPRAWAQRSSSTAASSSANTTAASDNCHRSSSGNAGGGGGEGARPQEGGERGALKGAPSGAGGDDHSGLRSLDRALFGGEEDAAADGSGDDSAAGSGADGGRGSGGRQRPRAVARPPHGSSPPPRQPYRPSAYAQLEPGRPHVSFGDAAAATAARAAAVAASASAALELSPLSSATASPSREKLRAGEQQAWGSAEDDGASLLDAGAGAGAAVARAQLLYRAQRRRTQDLEAQLAAQTAAYAEDRGAMLRELEERTRLHQEAIDELEKVAVALQRCRGELHAARAAQAQLESEVRDQGHALSLSEADATAATAMVTQLQVRVAELERQPRQADRHALEEQVSAVRRQHEAAADALRQRLAAAETRAAQAEERLRQWQQQQRQEEERAKGVAHGSDGARPSDRQPRGADQADLDELQVRRGGG